MPAHATQYMDMIAMVISVQVKQAVHHHAVAQLDVLAAIFVAAEMQAITLHLHIVKQKEHLQAQTKSAPVIN